MEIIKCFLLSLYLLLPSLAFNLLPKSPCPKIFNYEHDENSHAPIGSIVIGGHRNGFNNTIEVELSVALRVPSKQFISLDLVNMKQVPRKAAKYVIYFPNSVFIPQLTKITFNGKIICTGPPAKGFYVYTMNLVHYLILPPAQDGVNTHFIENFDNDNRVEQPVKEPSKIKDPNEYQDAIEIPEACGTPARKTMPLIFGGTAAQRHEWPWLAVLYWKNHDQVSVEFRCGASLISHTMLLTAAHCLMGPDGTTQLQPNELFISLGRYNIMDWTEPEAKTFQPASVRAHPKFRNEVIDYDIAIIELPTILPYSTNIRPICIWKESSNESLIVGQQGTVVGWGFTERNTISEVPRSIRVPIVSELDCIRADVRYQLTTSNRTLCAGGRGEGPCLGDSGGGLYILRSGQWYLRGIVSYALIDPDTGKCDTRKYSVYTDVARYRDWLMEQQQQQHGASSQTAADAIPAN